MIKFDQSSGERENWREREEKAIERKEKREEEKMSEKLQLLSRISGDRVVGFRQSKRKSSFMQQELRVGTKIQGFCQTPRGRVFLLLGFILAVRAIQMA